MFSAKGTLVYDPESRIVFEPWWLLLKTDKSILDYYQHWIKSIYDVDFIRQTVWGPHVSVNRGDIPPDIMKWRKYDGEVVDYKYSNRIYRKHWFFCVEVYSTRLEDIREEMGLSRLPPKGFHMTIGRIDKTYLERKRTTWLNFLDKSGLSSGYGAGPVSQLCSLTPPLEPVFSLTSSPTLIQESTGSDSSASASL